MKMNAINNFAPHMKLLDFKRLFPGRVIAFIGYGPAKNFCLIVNQ